MQIVVVVLGGATHKGFIVLVAAVGGQSYYNYFYTTSCTKSMVTPKRLFITAFTFIFAIQKASNVYAKCC